MTDMVKNVMKIIERDFDGLEIEQTIQALENYQREYKKKKTTLPEDIVNAFRTLHTYCMPLSCKDCPLEQLCVTETSIYDILDYLQDNYPIKL